MLANAMTQLAEYLFQKHHPQIEFWFDEHIDIYKKRTTENMLANTMTVPEAS